MRINTMTVWDMSGDELIEVYNESHEYDGEVSEAKGGGGGGTSTTVQSSEPWEGQKPYLTQSYEDIQNIGEKSYYPNQTFTPRTGLEHQADQMRLNYAQSQAPSLINTAQGSWQNSLNAMDVVNNPHVQSMMDANATAVNDNLMRNILPQIRGNAAGAGQYGGSREGIAQGLAIGDTQKALASANAQTMTDAYNTGAELQQYALGYAPTLLNMGYEPANMTEFVGQGQRQDQDMALQDDIARYNFNQYEPERITQLQASLLNGGMQFGTTTGTSTGGGYSRDPLQTGMGLASLGIGAYAAGLI